MKRRKRFIPPQGVTAFAPTEVVAGENDLLVGKPVPPPVVLTPSGPAAQVIDGENDLAADLGGDRGRPGQEQ